MRKNEKQILLNNSMNNNLFCSNLATHTFYIYIYIYIYTSKSFMLEKKRRNYSSEQRVQK